MGKTNIELKRIELSYFKGIKQKTIEFNHVTAIFGANATGKSTIADSFSWLLFGKNMAGQSDSSFAIKTLDADNNVIPKLEHSVEAWLTVGNEEINIKRVLKEKWVKKRGATESEYTGNTTDYYWNDVPKSLSEYNAKIASILDETVFKLISDPLAFATLHWEKQRSILISIVGQVDDTEIAKGNKDFEALMDKLSNKDLEEYKKELAAKRKKLNEAIRDIPSRIDEVTKTKPEMEDWAALEKENANIVEQIDKVESEIEDRNKAMESANKKRQEKSDEIYRLKTRNQNIEFEVKKEINAAQSGTPDPSTPLKLSLQSIGDNLDAYKSALRRLDSQFEADQEELKNVSVNIVSKREEWGVENAKELKFSEDGFDCPTCKRPMKAEDIESEKEKMKVDFNTDKRKALDLINEQGARLASRQKEIDASIEALEKRIEDGKSKIDEAEKEKSKVEKELSELESNKADQQESEVDHAEKLKSELQSNKEYQENIKTMADLQTSLDGQTGFDVSDLKASKSELVESANIIERKLNRKTLIEKADIRIKELEADEKKYAQQIADIEKEQFVVSEFTIAKVNALESKVIALFPVTKFKLFETQVNGSEVETCKATYLGVDWKDINTAGQVHCGVECINALSKYYEVMAPIFCDNSESVSLAPETDSQMIRLIVSEKHPKLTVI